MYAARVTRGLGVSVKGFGVEGLGFGWVSRALGAGLIHGSGVASPAVSIHKVLKTS